MIIGTAFLGKVKEINKQWIETKFFIFGLPLFPTSSMLVISEKHGMKQGLSIPLNAISVIAGYTRILTFLSAVFILGFVWFNPDPGFHEINPTLTVIGFVFAAIWFFFYFRFGKASKKDIEQRSKLGAAIGIYALPGWFNFNESLTNLKNLEYRYKENFQNNDWKTDLNSSHIPPEKRSILYALALFNRMVDQSAENEKLLDKADRLLEIV